MKKMNLIIILLGSVLGITILKKIDKNLMCKKSLCYKSKGTLGVRIGNF